MSSTYHQDSAQLRIGALIRDTGATGVWLAVLIVVASLAGTYPIKIIQRIVDTAAQGATEDQVRQILLYGALYILVFVAWSGAEYLLNTTYRTTEARTGHKVRTQIFRHALNLRPEFFARNRTGDVAADILKDSEVTTEQFLRPLVYVLQSATKFTIGLALMLSIDWRMTVFVIPIGVFSAVLARRTTGRVRSLAEGLRDATTRMWGRFAETIRGVHEIQANRAAETVFRSLATDSALATDRSIEQSRHHQAASAVNRLFYMTVIGLITTFGAYLVARGGMSVGGLAAFMMYNGLLTDPIMDFVDFYRELLRTNVSLERVNRFLSSPSFPQSSDAQQPRLTPSIRLQAVTFAYSADVPALTDVDLHVSEGEHLAIIGRSGCGKTTIARIISGIVFPQAGDVMIGDHRLTEHNLDLIRANIAVVFQQPFLFDGTIRDNLLLVDPKADDSHLMRAVELACLSESLKRIPGGIDGQVGENGNLLSGGERQRVGIARVFLQSTPLVVLDEATSALDASTTQQIIGNLRSTFRDSTLIMIAHKIASVEGFDRIILMDRGSIIANGPHDVLMASSAEYAVLYRDQFHARESDASGQNSGP